MSTSVKWRGREVQRPILRVLVVLVTVPFVLASAFLVVVFSVLVIVPLAIALHPLFLACGRRGTVRSDGGKLTLTIDRGAFRRARI